MTFEEFEKQARLFVLDALDEEEYSGFQEARVQFGERGETLITECRELNSVFALSLRPCAPRPATKVRLMARIRLAMKKDGGHRDSPPEATETCC